MQQSLYVIVHGSIIRRAVAELHDQTAALALKHIEEIQKKYTFLELDGNPTQIHEQMPANRNLNVYVLGAYTDFCCRDQLTALHKSHYHAVLDLSGCYQSREAALMLD
jgi:hypothetical protein